MPPTATLCWLAILSLAAGRTAASPFIPLDKGGRAPGPAPGAVATGQLDCAGAVAIALGGSYAGDNTGAPNNVTTYGCSAWNEAGGEIVHRLSLASPTRFRATILDATCDLDLIVLNACDEGAAHCLAVVDNGFVTDRPVSGEFFLVVDGFAGAACPFTLAVEEIPPASVCDAAEPLFCADQPLAGDTCDGENAVVTAGCLAYAENGREEIYTVTLRPGGEFTASVTFPAQDAALWVLDACAEPWNCLAGADDTYAGGTETITYRNTTGATQAVYLVVDSWGESCGAFAGTLSCSPGEVAAGGPSWGGVKARYR